MPRYIMFVPAVIIQVEDGENPNKLVDMFIGDAMEEIAKRNPRVALRWFARECNHINDTSFQIEFPNENIDSLKDEDEAAHPDTRFDKYLTDPKWMAAQFFPPATEMQQQMEELQRKIDLYLLLTNDEQKG